LAPTHGEQPGCYFIAEVRWKDDRGVGELRFGVAFDTAHVTGQQEKVKEEVKLRVAAYGLARSMDAVICFTALNEHLQRQVSTIAALVSAKGEHCRPQPRGDWDKIVEAGFPEGGNRRTDQPDFWGDGSLCYKAMAEIDFTKASGVDLIELLSLHGRRNGPCTGRVFPDQRPFRQLVREGGVEPPRPCGHTDLNRARLPIPPLARAPGQTRGTG
jgi:hypothetical protein